MLNLTKPKPKPLVSFKKRSLNDNETESVDGVLAVLVGRRVTAVNLVFIVVVNDILS